MSARIEHVVVLMLENRSFDCMLGRLYPNDPGYRGLTLNESNFYEMTYGVWNDPQMTPATACIPDPDPGEAFMDMNVQLFGQEARPQPAQTPTMSGFARNYGLLGKNGSYRDPGAVMHYFTPEQVPVMSALAKAFGVSDRWHASAPCQTWSNRFFAHTGTALGYVDNNTFRIPFEAPSVLRRLEDRGICWRVYFHDMPQSILLADVWKCALSHYRLFSQFLADAHTGALPNYSFIEPRYFTDLFSNLIPNDEHPPHNVLYGEQLIAQVYNAVRSSPCWKQTLLIITYDEHGGCYDHVPPPAAVPPGGAMNNAYGFRFDAYGVRVPTVMVSPYISPGSKIRPSGDTPFDHTSIISAVRQIFGLGDAFTARDEAAPNFLDSLNLAAPNNDGPVPLTAVRDTPDPDKFPELGNSMTNGVQAVLSAAAKLLPDKPLAFDAQVPNAAELPTDARDTVARSLANVTVRTRAFLGLPV